MKSMLSQGLLCDVTIVVGGKDFEAHKLVLVAGSDYFKSVFASQRPALGKPMQKERIVLLPEGAPPEIFALVLDSLYTGKVTVPAGTAGAVLRLSTHLGVASLRRRMTTYLCQIAHPESVAEIQALGRELKNQELLDAATAVAARKVVPVSSVPPVVPGMSVCLSVLRTYTYGAWNVCLYVYVLMYLAHFVLMCSRWDVGLCILMNLASCLAIAPAVASSMHTRCVCVCVCVCVCTRS
jgi:hypothetical protein